MEFRREKPLFQHYLQACRYLEALSGYYRGGFEPKMTKREASLILGVGLSTSRQRIRDAHRRIMLANHPDKGGSPYLASKINEAKDILESNDRS